MDFYLIRSLFFDGPPTNFGDIVTKIVEVKPGLFWVEVNGKGRYCFNPNQITLLRKGILVSHIGPIVEVAPGLGVTEADFK